MKILVVADSHGNPVPLKIAKKYGKNFDKIIFLGDFFDHGEEEFNVQKENFLDVMRFKRENPSQVIVLIGNHDANYIVPGFYIWQPDYGKEIKKLMEKYIKEFNMAYLKGKWLFSHAGFSQIWFKNQGFRDLTPAVISRLNTALHNMDFSYLQVCGLDPAGDDPEQNPLWIRPGSLIKCCLPGFNQVVGHTAVKEKIVKVHENGIILFLDSEPYLRNVYGEIDTETNNFSVKEFKEIWM